MTGQIIGEEVGMTDAKTAEALGLGSVSFPTGAFIFPPENKRPACTFSS